MFSSADQSPNKIILTEQKLEERKKQTTKEQREIQTKVDIENEAFDEVGTSGHKWW